MLDAIRHRLQCKLRRNLRPLGAQRQVHLFEPALAPRSAHLGGRLLHAGDGRAHLTARQLQSLMSICSQLAVFAECTEWKK